MSKELVIASNRHETKAAVLEEDQLVELFFQRANEYSLAGSIHKGRVTRVLPGMQSAFVDLGLERDTFLYVSDFFEENDDIDALLDDKPSRREERSGRSDWADRRDRGPRRGPERVSSIEQRDVVPRDAVPAPEPAATDSQIAEDESGVPGAELSAAPAAPQTQEPKTFERTDNDRGFRDRRNRRSRRRRQRGRGFPENKYAQPLASSPAEPEPSRSEPSQRESSADVIILPGESLAKYRNRAAGPDASAFDVSEPDDAASEPITPEEEEAIEEEAEALELTEKVLGHHDDESPQDLEEEIEEVKSDQPVPPPPVFDEEDRTTTFDAQASVNAQEHPLEERNAELASESGGMSATEFAEARLDVIPESGADSSETPEIIEADESVLDTNESSEGASSQPQSASFREQGGRYLHRVSRRMRRRRGGNRFGSNPEFGASTAGGAGAGAAVAFEADVRRETYEEPSSERPERGMPSISDLLKPGQEIIVQIAKEPLGQKGARITSHVALPGRFVVFMPSVNHMGVSRKIASDEERQRLKRILQAHRVGTTGGFIVRTAGEGVPEDEIAADMNFLYNLWLDIRQKAEKKPAPALLHYDLDIVQRILRDQVTDEFKSIWVDNEELYENVLTFMQRFQPAFVSRVKLYTRSAPIFDAFNITQELEKALRPKVWLKSGGYIVINQTEALVAIDINTGKFVGKSNRLEDTIVKTNTEAVKEIVRQIRLRDLGGIIVVDFIDMEERKNRQKVMQALEEAMRADRAPYK
ncbi:MAG: Rne/Rng family ribonuclease, partial [Acidobacteriaceae bacterium]|nr:Rne/Rng family ribonuclease [Acidobacteriaceae bacterium]